MPRKANTSAPGRNRRWLTVEETADYLEVSRRQVRRWAQEHKLTYRKLGLRLEFHRDVLDQFVREHTIKAEPSNQRG